MAKFTFLELHLDDATITNNAPYSGADLDEADEDGATAGDDSGGRSVLTLGVLVLAVVAVALGARSLLGDEEPIPEPDELV